MLKPNEIMAQELDAQDSLQDYRSPFYIPRRDDGNDCIYLCGNSLGLQPKSVMSFIEQELTDWATLGVEGHFHAKHPWMAYHELLRNRRLALLVQSHRKW